MSKINLVPYSCPRANQCREFLYYKIAVKKIKNNQQYFLNHIEELRKIAYNCPHQIEDGFWNGFLPSDEWLLYLKCDIFSDWFWNEAIQAAKSKRREGKR